MYNYRIAVILGGEIKGYEFPDVQLFTSKSPDEAYKIAQDLIKKDEVDLFIGTSSMADDLSKNISVPVIRVDASEYDLLEVMRFAENKSPYLDGKLALLIHESRKLDVRMFQPFLTRTLVLYSYRKNDEIERIVQNIGNEQNTTLIGGPVVMEEVARRGLEGYSIHIGKESLNTAILQAKQIINFNRRSQEQRRRVETALDLFSYGVLITNTQGKVTNFNNKACEMFQMQQEEIIKKCIDDIIDDASCYETYKGGLNRMEKIVDLGGCKLLSNQMAVISSNEVVGGVYTFQDASEIERLEHKIRRYQSKGLYAQYRFSDIIGRSSALQSAKEKAMAYAKVDSNVLINGETGVGKELFVQSIHNSSLRRKGPFVAVNCAAIPEQLLESELMGYEKGAFTGSNSSGKPGMFELAHGGTIFLDEVCSIPIQMQAKILRVIQEKQVIHLGGDRIIPVNFRVISASNQNLLKLVSQGKMRQDLYYRLNVLNLVIPPLRMHKEDIVQLIQFYFRRFTRKYGEVKPFSNEAMQILESYSWPGNIRELINCVERFVVISKVHDICDVEFVNDFIMTEQLDDEENAPFSINDGEFLRIKPGTLEEMEHQLVKEMLRQNGNNKLQTAHRMKISRTTLRKKLEQDGQNIAT